MPRVRSSRLLPSSRCRSASRLRKSLRLRKLRLIEEEERKYREEEEAREEARRIKREAKAAKIAKQKAEGTYQTNKEKEREKRAQILREQFGFGANDDDEQGATKLKGVISGKKKKHVAQERKDDEKAEGAKAEATAVETKDEEEDKGPNWEEKEWDDEETKDADEEDDEEDEEDDEGEEEEEEESGYRSPIVCIMGHVDTGKTKLLDKIRHTNVQEGEAGGITQQIGATFFPDLALMEQTSKVDEDFEMEVPGLLIIDTPGHESFANLRTRGSSLCDIAILVVDIMHGLEPQTVESLEMLKKRRCPFIIALNKIDRMFEWQSKPWTTSREALARQEQNVRDEFERRKTNTLTQLSQRGLNCDLYWNIDDYRSMVSVVPTSAMTGEGVPDLLYIILELTQTLMPAKLEVQEELQCTVIEVKTIEGLGTTIDCVLVNGTLNEGDTIVCTGMNGPIVTTIRALLTPHPMKEMRVKNEYVHHKKLSTSMGVKICAPNIEEAVAGTALLVCGPDDDLEELKEEAEEEFDSILNDFEKQPEGVFVMASTLGSLEALLAFLEDSKIPVCDVAIGEVHKKHVKRAQIMKDKKHPEYAVILAFDVKISSEAKSLAETVGVQIMPADIIYHLFDQFTAYMKKVKEKSKA